MYCPMKPAFKPTTDFDRRIEEFPVQRLENEWATIGEREANRLAVSEEYRRRFLDGDRRAIAKLLQINREFALEPWVREALGEEETLRNVVSDRGGRPVGRSQETEQLGFFIFAHVSALQRGTGMSREAIFDRLGRGRLNLSRERIKHLFYETASRSRLRAMLFAEDGKPHLTGGA